MASRTRMFALMPWTGGINTSVDESLISSNQLTVADNCVFDTRGSRRPRDGINFNWDASSNKSANVIAEHDYWYGNSSKTQKLVSVMSDGTVYSYQNGVRTQVTVGGQAWSGTLTNASMATYGNWLLISVSGTNNNLKYWDGTNSLQDVYNRFSNTALKRSSSGTTRTLVFSEAVGGGLIPVTVGSTVVVANCGNSAYNGTFTVASISTTTVSSDTITYTASSSLTESLTTDTTTQIGNLAPKVGFIREHLNRIFGTDKTNVDRLHFTPTGDPFVWWGWGDSGALNIGSGDGDPIGLNGIAPTFKGTLFVGKLTKLYRIDGYTPDTWQISKVSDGIGFASHNSIVAIDQDDMVFVSERGVHSMAATQAYGDFESQYVSIDIQKTFNEGFNHALLANIWAAYNAQLNSVAFTFADASSATNNQIYLYNIPQKAWYRWPNISCTSLICANDSDKKRFYIGSATGRVAKAQNGTTYDNSADGSQTTIPFRVTTGQIFVDSNPYSMKSFRRFILFFKPFGSFNVTVNVTIDNHALNSENSISYSQTSSGGILASTLVLGQSLLGSAIVVLGPYNATIDGYGRGVKIDIVQNGIGDGIEIQGIAIEYEGAGAVAEVQTT